MGFEVGLEVVGLDEPPLGIYLTVDGQSPAMPLLSVGTNLPSGVDGPCVS